MNRRFADVKILIWDFDGTLYKPNPKLFGDVREAEYRVIMVHKGWNREKIVEQFHKVWPKEISSATEAVAKITGITTVAAATEMESYYDRRPYLLRDKKLMDLFSELKYFTHYLLVNGIKRKIEESLDVLGVPIQTFSAIVTSELVGSNKPNPAGFQYILNKTRLSPGQHLMIGDRPGVDLAPAKNLGMKTCLVWSSVADPHIDICLPTVYEVADLLR